MLAIISHYLLQSLSITLSLPLNLSFFLYLSLSLCNKIDVTPSLMGSHLAFPTISALLMNRFGRYLQYCHLEFDEESISDGCRVKIAGIGGGF